MALVSEFAGIIFDYGGVLVHHQTDEDQVRMAEVAGMPKKQFTDLYWLEREDYDKGLVAAGDYWQKIASLAGARFSAEVVEQLIELDTLSWMQFDSVMWEWLEQLRGAGKRLAMLSNMPRELGEALKTTTSRLDQFDHVTLSYELHIVKPEPAIYSECLDGLGTPLEKTLFLDDRIANVQAAQQVGLRSIHFTSRDEVLPRLRS
jgi:putative hydrolase of the HAD superfamily